MKLNREEKAKVKSFIQFENGLISDKDQLENDLIKFCNGKYRQKYKQNDDKYEYIISQLPPDSDGEVKRLVLEDNEFYERVSIVLYQESTKHYRSLGINTKNESYNIDPVGSRDIGVKRQYDPYYQLNGEKVYLSFESSDDYSETSTTQWKVEQVHAKEYTETERSMDEAINSLFEQYYNSDNKSEILYQMLFNFNKFGSFDFFNHEALKFFINLELEPYHPTNHQLQIIQKIFDGEKISKTDQRSLRKMLGVKYKKKPSKKN